MAISVPELAGVAGIEWSQADETATDTTKTIVLRGKADHGELFNDPILEALRESRVGEYGWYAGHTIRYGAGRQFDEIEVTCIDLTVTYNSSGYYSRFEAQARTEARPLEEKITKVGTNDETYLTWWNHRVVCPIENESIVITGGGADDWKAITDLSIPSGYTPSDSKKPARWVKANQALKEGDYVLLDARFPGVQSYGVPMEQVKEVIYARSESIVKGILPRVGSLKAPKDSFNNYYDSSRTDDSNWLITSANYARSTGWYEANITYAYAKDWLSRGAVGNATGVYANWSEV